MYIFLKVIISNITFEKKSVMHVTTSEILIIQNYFKNYLLRQIKKTEFKWMLRIFSLYLLVSTGTR